MGENAKNQVAFARRKIFMYMLAILLSFMVALLVVITMVIDKRIDFERLYDYLITIFLGVAGTSVSLVMFTYLQKRNGTQQSNTDIKNTSINIERSIKKLLDQQYSPEYQYDRSKIIDRLSKIEEKLDNNSKVEIDLSKNDEIFDKVKESFINNIDTDFFKDLNVNIAKEANQSKDRYLEEISHISYNSRDRIFREISDIGKKSNINLAIGSGLTAVALIFLIYNVVVQYKSYGELKDILNYYIPRISFVIFLEIFAFFFLKLYKLNINDLKYYQNELTNIELKHVSIISALTHGGQNDISSVINTLSSTERNFVIEKGQSTIELEKIKMDNSSFDKFGKLLKEILKIKK